MVLVGQRTFGVAGAPLSPWLILSSYLSTTVEWMVVCFLQVSTRPDDVVREQWCKWPLLSALFLSWSKQIILADGLWKLPALPRSLHKHRTQAIFLKGVCAGTHHFICPHTYLMYTRNRWLSLYIRTVNSGVTARVMALTLEAILPHVYYMWTLMVVNPLGLKQEATIFNYLYLLGGLSSIRGLTTDLRKKCFVERQSSTA